MEINIIDIVALISTALAIYWGFINATRDKKAETKEEAITLATIVNELEAVQNNISELKQEVREEMRKPINEHSERLIKIEVYNETISDALLKIDNKFKNFEDSIKRIHSRLDELSLSNSVHLKKERL